MDFLKDLLGEDLFKQIESKINEHNGNEANKDKQIKLANLGAGEYVGKGKYDSLNEMLSGKQTELDAANGLIAELKKGAKGNEESQGKITNYETVTIPQLQAQLAETQRRYALKLALMSENCSDVDYASYKLLENLKENGKALELDENENIKGWNDLISGLKTQIPNQFPTGTNGRKVLGDNRLPDRGTESGAMTKADLLKKPYAERAEFARNNPEAYASIMK